MRSPSSKPKVLVVDDEQELCDLHCSLLQENDIECETAYEVNQAINILSRRDRGFDFILADYRLKDGTAEDLFSYLQTLEDPPDVIVASGIPSLSIESDFKILDILEKPIDLDALANRIKT